MKNKEDVIHIDKILTNGTRNLNNNLVTPDNLPEILFITSFPPRECGIATYSQDLIKALNNKFHKSFKIKICALESEYEKHAYNDDIKHILNTNYPDGFKVLAENINSDSDLLTCPPKHR